jgi:hypothetical protein
MAAGDCEQLHLADYVFGPHNLVAVKVRSDLAFAKLKALAEGAAIVRRELRGG